MEREVYNKLWHDDIRKPPDDSWTWWARTNEQARQLLVKYHVHEISLDHDLGLDYIDVDKIQTDDPDLLMGSSPEEDGYDLVKWICERPHLVPGKITIHSWNPIGAKRMEACFKDAGIDCIRKEFDPNCRQK